MIVATHFMGSMYDMVHVCGLKTDWLMEVPAAALQVAPRPPSSSGVVSAITAVQATHGIAWKWAHWHTEDMTMAVARLSSTIGMVRAEEVLGVHCAL